MPKILRKINNIIQDFITQVTALLGNRIKKIILHGSYIAFDIEFNNEFDVMLSPLVKNIDKFNYWIQALPFYMNVQKEGVVLSKLKGI